MSLMCSEAEVRNAVSVIEIPSRYATATVWRFQGASGVGEAHVTLALTRLCKNPAAALQDAWLEALATVGIDPATTMMRRVFCTDVMNQADSLAAFETAVPGAFSIIGQALQEGGKFALWSQHLIDDSCEADIKHDGGSFSITRGELCHHGYAGLADPQGADALSQTKTVLKHHIDQLSAHGMTLADHVVRTWWYLRDVDFDYPGFVAARREIFDAQGLTNRTHYIASTGIAGIHVNPSARVSLDSYAIAGLRPEQIEYLHAPTHLGCTSKYGVTFERATAISYADRRHIFLSGTASIDPEGNILHPGNVLRQLDRALENAAALLADANAGLADLAMLLVYLRDPADSAAIRDALRERIGTLPVLVLHAPVCRPGWLVEIEGIAVIAADQPNLPNY